MDPNYIILLDVGLRAKERAIFSMYYYLRAHPTVGGVCGYMSLKIERTEEEEEVEIEELDWLTNTAHTFVDIQRAQQVEYHFAHLLDKPFESLFDFIHVLPGAFSGYSMRAIHNPADEEETILRKYFESLSDKLTENHIVETEMTLLWMAAKVLLPDFAASCFLTANPNSEEQMLCNENMNLAEDRILCFGIHKNGFDLAFLPDAYSEVDPIKNLHSLLGQRKRWINGSFFAF
jgi:chitin synthase